jgi:hypothetical protein
LKQNFAHRFAIHRAGVFYRWEQLSDGGEDVKKTTGDDVDVTMEEELPCHQVPIHLMANRNSYTVNDVLGIVTGPPDVDHITVPKGPTLTTASSLRQDAATNAKSLRPTGSGSHLSAASPGPAKGRKKRWFCPTSTSLSSEPCQVGETACALEFDGWIGRYQCLSTRHFAPR